MAIKSNGDCKTQAGSCQLEKNWSYLWKWAYGEHE